MSMTLPEALAIRVRYGTYGWDERTRTLSEAATRIIERAADAVADRQAKPAETLPYVVGLPYAITFRNMSE